VSTPMALLPDSYETETLPIASTLEVRVRELEIELRRVERERDVLKKALAIFGRNE